MDSPKIDTELVSNVIANHKRGKAIDIDGLSAEHFQYSHPSLCVVLSKVFQLMMLFSIVPEGSPLPFGRICFVVLVMRKGGDSS